MVKQKIIEKFGTLNNFYEKKRDQLTISHTHLYKLLAGEEINPTISTLINLSKLAEIPFCDVCEEFRMLHEENANANSATE